MPNIIYTSNNVPTWGGQAMMIVTESVEPGADLEPEIIALAAPFARGPVQKEWLAAMQDRRGFDLRAYLGGGDAGLNRRIESFVASLAQTGFVTEERLLGVMGASRLIIRYAPEESLRLRWRSLVQSRPSASADLDAQLLTANALVELLCANEVAAALYASWTGDLATLVETVQLLLE